ncbi:bifunctional metallophosphatase/5'-nucleotidase [Allosphingosinicella sp.]|uniref:bifunctional metallophosphatase/5'-nucleotidase n=1 Tax=Allosphingosinicella sp. TaxID=2823234 RepID=UPI003782D8FA
MKLKLWFAALLTVACLSAPTEARRRAAPVRVNIIAFNDFHGALEPPRMAMTAPAPGGTTVRVPVGGAAYLASAIQRLRAGNPNNVVVTAGDLIGASALISAEFLDEPTILAMNLIGLDYSAVGNHEFDRGRQELLRMQNGGCARYTNRQPCRLDRFPGARFQILSANVRTQTGQTLFPGTALRSFGTGRRRVRVGFIGLTLRDTSTLVIPTGIAGLTFEDEADTINAAARRLRAQGADAVVVLIHQGLDTRVGYNDHSCGGVTGDLLPILGRLDRSVDVVVSGHTHHSYICDYGRIDATRPFLVTSAEKNGALLTNISLSIDPARHRVTAKSADNVLVQGEGYADRRGEVPLSNLYPVFLRDPAVAALVARYAAVATPIIARPIGRLGGSALKRANDAGESAAGDLIADAFFAATSSPATGGAQLAFTNQTSVRVDLVPAADGTVTFGQLFEMQPYGNNLVVVTMTGRQIRAALEQQFASGPNTVDHPIMLQPSRGFTYAFDLRQPEGQRIVDMRLNGAPISDDVSYRVTINSFLASGGDSFTAFRQGTNPTGGVQDVDALESYIAALGQTPPPLPPSDRIRRLSPR